MVAIGMVTKPHGIRGEFRIKYLTDFPERFHALDSVYVEMSDNSFVPYDIEYVRLEHEGACVKLITVDDRNKAEALRGSYLCVTAEETVVLEDDTFYVYDLVGIDVFDTGGNAIGRILSVENYPANDIMILDTGKGTAMIPAVKAFIEHLDLDSKRMTVVLPEGLIPESEHKDRG